VAVVIVSVHQRMQFGNFVADTNDTGENDCRIMDDSSAVKLPKHIVISRKLSSAVQLSLE
jgi:hypothetical protein